VEFVLQNLKKIGLLNDVLDLFEDGFVVRKINCGEIGLMKEEVFYYLSRKGKKYIKEVMNFAKLRYDSQDLLKDLKEEEAYFSSLNNRNNPKH
jgi:DNA-binding PadR family transcriptional regulator